MTNSIEPEYIVEVRRRDGLVVFRGAVAPGDGGDFITITGERLRAWDIEPARLRCAVTDLGAWLTVKESA